MDFAEACNCILISTVFWLSLEFAVYGIRSVVKFFKTITN